MRLAAFSAALLLAGAALAQEADPALEDLNVNPPQSQGPSELDALSQGSDTSDFPDIEVREERRPVSVTIRALDKVTAKYTDITIDMGKSATFGTLDIAARFCDKRPPEEFPETSAFLQITDNRGAPAPDLKIPEPKKKKKEAKAEPVADHSGAAAIAQDPAEKPKLPGNMVFSGWMFASSPALNALEHPVYDVWVIDCKTVKVGS
jgi:hypothetical protein